jgi:hypothetical protein
VPRRSPGWRCAVCGSEPSVVEFHWVASSARSPGRLKVGRGLAGSSPLREMWRAAASLELLPIGGRGAAQIPAAGDALASMARRTPHLRRRAAVGTLLSSVDARQKAVGLDCESWIRPSPCEESETNSATSGFRSSAQGRFGCSRTPDWCGNDSTRIPAVDSNPGNAGRDIHAPPTAATR